ncbi:MAG TPA: ATP-binding protein [Acidimicrobiales bacterium]|nr:ATP-binding protein [Acidimicrobiales bacterium]
MEARGYVDDGVASIALPWSARSSAAARQFIREVLGAWQLTAVETDAELCASEMVANALLHAAGDSVLVLRRTPDRLRIEVTDGHPGSAGRVLSGTGPVGIAVAADDLSPVGRGLGILAAITADWGVTASGATKTIWAVIDTGPPVHDDRIEIQMADIPVALALANAEFCEDLLVRVRQALAKGHAGVPADGAGHFVAAMEATTPTRRAGRLEAQAAADAGMARYTARVTAGPADFEKLQMLDQLLDAMSAALPRRPALPGPPERELRAFRQWVEVEARRQLQGAGPHPCPFPVPPVPDGHRAPA